MSMFFVVHRLPDGKPECKHFQNVEELFAWLHDFYDMGAWPAGMKIYRAECLFDGGS